MRVDPESDTVDAEIQIDKLLDQTNLVTVDDSVWVLTKEGAELTPIDAQTNESGKPIALGGTCTDVAASEGEIWVTCYVDSRVLRVDPAAGEVAAEIDLDRPRAIALGKDLWVGFDLGLAQLDPETLKISPSTTSSRAPAGRSSPAPMTWSRGRWALPRSHRPRRP